MTLELVESEPGYREFRFTGPLELDDLRELRGYDFFADGVRPARALIDLTQMEITELPLDQLAFEINFRHDDELPPFLAVLAQRNITFGRMRQLIQFQGVGHRVRVFGERQEALDWLASVVPTAEERAPHLLIVRGRETD